MKVRGDSESVSKSSSPARAARGSRKPVAEPVNGNWPRERMIAEAAYFRAEQRGFAPGNEMSDWLQAEAEVAGALGNIQ